MEGLMVFSPPDTVVGKQSEYKTKTDFLMAAMDNDGGYNYILSKKYAVPPSENGVYEALVRYYPRGTEDSQMEFGAGNGVYMFTDKESKGTFKVWCL